MVSGIDLISTLPFAVATVFGIVVLLLEVFQRPSFSRAYLGPVTAVGCALTALSANLLSKLDPTSVFGGMAALDPYGMTLAVACAAAGGLAAMVAPAYLAEQRIDHGEYHALILFAVAGMVGMVTATDFVTFFVGLEIQSVAMYALASYHRTSARSAEAGAKYFILGAFASAIFVYGVALLYGATGSTNFSEIGAALSRSLSGDAAAALARAAEQGVLTAAAGVVPDGPAALENLNGVVPHVPMAAIGLLFVVVAFAVKIAAAPFHMWAPDAYSGAPTPVVGFMAAAAKAAGIGALVRVLALGFFDPALRMGPYGWVQILFWVALISMVVGNLVAISQTNVKRMLAYSSVAHAGYLLVAVVAMGHGAGDISRASGTVFYAFAYTFGTVGAFGVLAYLGKRGVEAERFDDLNGVGFKYPWLGACMTVFMLSSAGIPPTAGFMGKFMLFRAGVEAAVDATARGFVGTELLMALVFGGILTSVAGVYYYLRVVVHLYMKKPVRAVGGLPQPVAAFAIVVCAAASLWYGIFPGSLAERAESVTLITATAP